MATMPTICFHTLNLCLAGAWSHRESGCKGNWEMWSLHIYKQRVVILNEPISSVLHKICVVKDIQIYGFPTAVVVSFSV